MATTKSRSILGLVVSILVCEMAGLVGSIFTMPAISTWYATLVKPSFIPPNAAFGPVWITLYALMGIAVFMVWRSGVREPEVKPALAQFAVQLILNVLWSVVFFGFHSLLGGVVIILLLWLAILMTIILFFKVSAVAGWLLIPYIVWVSLASALNVWIWANNG